MYKYRFWSNHVFPVGLAVADVSTVSYSDHFVVFDRVLLAFGGWNLLDYKSKWTHFSFDSCLASYFNQAFWLIFLSKIYYGFCVWQTCEIAQKRCVINVRNCVNHSKTMLHYLRFIVSISSLNIFLKPTGSWTGSLSAFLLLVCFSSFWISVFYFLTCFLHNFKFHWSWVFRHWITY